MVLDKNPEINLNDDLKCIQNEFKNNVPSLVLCLNSFHKIEFLDKLISSIKNPIIFVDMDLLYSGYIESKMIKQKENVEIFRPNKLDWKERLSEIICKISEKNNVSKRRVYQLCLSLKGKF